MRNCAYSPKTISSQTRSRNLSWGQCRREDDCSLIVSDEDSPPAESRQSFRRILAGDDLSWHISLTRTDARTHAHTTTWRKRPTTRRQIGGNPWDTRGLFRAQWVQLLKKLTSPKRTHWRRDGLSWSHAHTRTYILPTSLFFFKFWFPLHVTKQFFLKRSTPLSLRRVH